MAKRLDSYGQYPSGMEEYLEAYGWSFSKRMSEWAISKMRDRNGKKIEMLPKEKVDAMLKQHGVEIKEDKGYDSVYVFHMIKSDFWGSSITNEQMMAKMVGDIMNDPDGYEGMVFTRFYADCIGSGTPIIWEDYM